MDQDRIDGADKQAKGSVEKATGTAHGDSKLDADGKNDKAMRQWPRRFESAPITEPGFFKEEGGK